MHLGKQAKQQDPP